MKNKDQLGDRMKRYEEVSNSKLTRRTPVILRLDGVSFHVFTRGFKKPFDNILVKSMQETMLYLAKNIQGCAFGYTQSDEITLVLTDYKDISSDAWFDYKVEKLCSVAASMATLNFNMFFAQNVKSAGCEDNIVYNKKINTAIFDCRAFNVPLNDVTNCLIWRQKDAEKNSISSLAQTMYTASELKGVSTKNLQDKMFTEKGVNWNELETYLKRGSACKKNEENKWFLDLDMPILMKDRKYSEDTFIFDIVN